MQAVAVAKITFQAPAGAVPAASGASDAAAVAAADGVDFAALLAAQFQGAGGVVLPVSGAEVGVARQGSDGTAGAFKTDIVQDYKAGITQDFKTDIVQDFKTDIVQDFKTDITQDFKADISPEAQAAAFIDPALQAMALMAGVVPVMPTMQQVTPEIKQPLSALSPDKSLGERRISAFPSLVNDGELPTNDKTSLLAIEGAAEFAVGGKSLPSGGLKDVGVNVADVFSKPPTLPVDAPSLEAPRTPDALSAVSAIMSASQSRAVSEIKIPLGSVQPPVGASGWGDALGQKVVWMAGQHQQVAELHLNPPNLGPMEVRLTISNDQVSALFVSHQPAVREAIEAAMPRLREMFADSGMMLGNASVSSDSLPRQQNSGQERQSGAGSSPPDFPLVEGYSMPVTSHGIMHLSGDGRGLVDLFA